MNQEQTPFEQLLMSLQVQGMISLGKIKNPMTNKVEKNLQVAKSSVKILEALHEKTEGNLSEEEESSLNRKISELRKSYVEEANKDNND